MKHLTDMIAELRYCADLVRRPLAHPEIVGYSPNAPDYSAVTRYLAMQAATAHRSGWPVAFDKLIEAATEFTEAEPSTMRSLAASMEYCADVLLINEQERPA